MNISKLIISPIERGMSSVISKSPDNDIASILIKERLSCRNLFDNYVPRALKKVPKHIKSWVNPNTIVKHKGTK